MRPLTSQLEKVGSLHAVLADGKLVTKFLTNVNIQAGTPVSIESAVTYLCPISTVCPAETAIC